MKRQVHAASFGSIRVRTPLVMSGQRVGIMGGTFNPPHEGHRIVAETAVKRLGLDQLWWVVTPGNPLKSHGGLPPQAERTAACKPFARGPKMKITGFEAELGTPYTAATLEFLRTRYRGVNFVWVMGADNLATFARWQNWHGIAENMPIAVVDRPGWRFRALAGVPAHRYRRARVDERGTARLAGKCAPAWTFLTSRLSAQSSTKLRGSAANTGRARHQHVVID